MLKVLSNSRKKKPAPKLASSTAKQPRQSHKQPKQHKQAKHAAKHNHHASTLTLLSQHNASVASHASLLGQSKSTAIKKAKSQKHKESTLSMVHKDGKEAGNKQKQKSKTNKQGKKAKKNSSLNPNSKSKKNIIKISPQKNEKLPKQNPSKKRNVTRQQQLYERINIGLFKSKTNSQINFSSSSSVRENQNVSNLQQSRNKKILTIDCSDEYILNQYFSNSRIKNQQKKRVQAAIKIQKVFRGYMTRKILKAYTEKIQHQFQKFGRKKKNSAHGKQMLSLSQSKNKNRQYFDEINQQQGDNTKKKIRKVSNDIFINDDSARESIKSKDNKFSKINQIQPIDFEISLRNSRKQVLPPIDHAALQQQSSIMGNQESLSRYLPFQQKYITIRPQYEQYQQENDEGKVSHGQNYVIKQQSHQKSASDYFKLTPPVSSQQSKSKDEPIPTDFSEKRIPQFQFDAPTKSKELQPNYNKKNKIAIQYTETSTQNFNMQSAANSIEYGKKTKQFQKNKQFVNKKYFKNVNSEQEANNILKKQKNLIKTLKKQQQQKWNKIILMLNQQIRYSKEKNQDNSKFMNMILQFSKKNKEELEKSTSFIEEATNSISKQIQKQKKANANFKLFSKNKNEKHEQQQQQFEDHDLNLTTQLIKAQKQKAAKNENMPLIRKKNHNPSSVGENKENLCQTLLEKTELLKNLYRKNYSSYPIEQMIEIREQALQKRQKQSVNKLNQDLYNSVVTHEQFITRLAEMQQQFEKQRQLIMKAKTQIFVGYKATRKLMQDSFRDAWYLGCKIPFSQSLKDFKQNYTGSNLWVKQLIVDQLRSFANGNTFNMSGSIKFAGANKTDNLNASSLLNNSNQIVDSHKKESIKQPSLLDQEELYSKQSQRKRQELSISLPYEDSSLTLKHQPKSNQVSQQSVYSQQISYNEGDVQIHNLGQQAKPDYIFDDSFSQESSEEQAKTQQKIEGFKKVDPERLMRRSLNNERNEVQGPLLLDPDEQQQIDSIVIRKISINQKKRPNYDTAYDNFQHLTRTDMTPRNSSIVFRNQPKSEVYKVDIASEQSEEDEKANRQNQNAPPQIIQITEQQWAKLIWQATSQIYVNMHMRSKFCKIKHKSPHRITYEEQTRFMELLQKQIPSFMEVQPRLNQKMTANRLQLLKFLRVNFDEDEEGSFINQMEQIQNYDNQTYNGDKSQTNQGFEQIGKFQHILPTDICTNTLNKYLQQADKANNQKILNLNQQNNQQVLANKVKQELKQKVSMQCVRKVTERQKSYIYSEMQKNGLRRQITKIECHCIFDSLNQILIRKRIKFSGYSGIGLNQLTMIMKNEQNFEMKQQKQYKQLIGQSMKELRQLLSVQKTSGQKLLLENYERLCENDSQWIYYTEEALSFALQFVYMLEDEIFFEETACIFKKLKKL